MNWVGREVGDGGGVWLRWEERVRVMGGTNRVPKQKIERKRVRDKRDRGKAVVSRGGRGNHLCLPQPLNITMVHNIFNHRASLISHDKSPLPPLVVSSLTGPIRVFIQSLSLIHV